MNSLKEIAKMTNKRKYFVFAFVVLIISSCGSDDKSVEQNVLSKDPKAEILNRIKNLEDQMHRSEKIDNVLAGQALQIYHEYSQAYPTDVITPDYLFKAGEIATAIQQYPQAYSHYKTISEKYPTYKMVQESLFLQASILDNYLNEDDKAKVVYEDLIKRYPESSYASDAKAAISNLGKSDEDLIKEFKKKNKEK